MPNYFVIFKQHHERIMGLTPSHWGPYFWGTIHITCLGAPEALDETDKQAYAQFFKTMPFILPCGSCGKHFYDTLQVEPVERALASKHTLFAWSVRVHNIVNKRLGKPEWTLHRALDHWNRVCMGEPSQCPKTSPPHSVVDDKAWLEMMIIFVIGLSVGGGVGFLFAKKLEQL